jgi:stearoyl-CoA desaturase (delta-9 desaturase)
MLPTSMDVDAPSESAVTVAPVPSGDRAPAGARSIPWSSAPFFVLQLSPALILLTGVGTRSLVLLAVTYWGRMFCITAGYHRYFAHRSYRLARVPQFLLALAGTSAMQRGPLWWAAHHRDHHRFADRPGDPHSPLGGFWSSHLLWIVRDENGRTRTERIPDLVKYPELRFLDRCDMIGPVLVALTCWLVDGWRGVVVGFLTSTVLLWHATFTINSLAHLMGRRRYDTTDTSRNSFILAVLTMGEGWHNNHHYRPSSCRNGFYWWEWDPTWYLIRAFEVVGVATGVRSVSKAARGRRRVDGEGS